MTNISPYDIQDLINNRDLVKFTNIVLGMPTHPGQEYWMRESVRPINVLKPANQWGKTTAEACKHIFHAVCKPRLDKFPDMELQDRISFEYRTLNFGKTYEVAKGVMEAIIDITQGHFLLPTGKYNRSMLAGWAIKRIDDTPKLPRIVWWNNSKTLIRSWDGLGESFKRLRLAFISGDECGDVPELKLFLNGTLLPRLFFFEGKVDLVGTSQPKGLEYEEIAEEGEKEMEARGKDARVFVLSARNNPDMATVYRNDFMPAESIREIEAISDPELRKQIIYGQYVDWNKHIYTYEEVTHMFVPDIPYDPETGVSEQPDKNGTYIFSVDMAASEDETSCTCIRYAMKKTDLSGKVTFFPHKVVFHKAWKGATMPLSLQYELIKEYYRKYQRVAPTRTKFVYDAGSLGGKNAGDAFRELHGYPFPPKGSSYAQIKAEGMGKVKEVLGRYREFTVDEKGRQVDKNPNWGGVKASIHLKELRRQLETASKDDDKLKNDQYTSFMQAIHFIEMRAPKQIGGKVVRSFNILV